MNAPEAPAPDAAGVAALRARLAAAEAALAAIRRGEVDALVVPGEHGPQIYTRDGADRSYRILIEQMYEGAAALGPQGEILYCNRRLADLLGLPLEQVLGQPLDGLLDADGAGAARTLRAAVQQGGHAAGEAQAARTGTPLLLAFSALPGEGGARFGLVASDLTAQKSAAESKARQAHLEALVTERTAELRHALDAAQAAGRAKSAFLANMSHEIRTPLNAVLGLAHLLRQDGLSPVQAERLARIEQAGQHLLRLLVDVLELSKIEASELLLRHEPLDPARVLRQIAGLLQQQARDKGLQLQLSHDALPPQVLGDGTRLAQALLNLAGNAVKFTEAGRVALRASVVERRAGSVVLMFEVEDTGIGIAPEVAARLFQPFEQGGDGVHLRHGGSGLGLAITRQIAQRMGGDAGLRSQPGRGSTFWLVAEFDCPAEPGAEPAALRPLADDLAALLQQRHRGCRVLVVEDDAVSQEVTLAMLAAAGIEAEGAWNGAQALERLALGPPHDLVLMDMEMPGLDGVATTARLRERGWDMPVIALTANAFAEHRLRCLDAGMDEHLAKPVDPVALYGLLLNWLGRPRDGRRALQCST